MTEDHLPVTTDEEFKVALTHLLRSAYASGVTVDRPWLCRTDDGEPDWEAEVVKLDESGGE